MEFFENPVFSCVPVFQNQASAVGHWQRLTHNVLHNVFWIDQTALTAADVHKGVCIKEAYIDFSLGGLADVSDPRTQEHAGRLSWFVSLVRP